MSCAESFSAYAFRAIGYGERLLPRTDINLCDQIVLIGSGMVWNLYFAILAVITTTAVSGGSLIRKDRSSRSPRWLVFQSRHSLITSRARKPGLGIRPGKN